MKVMSISNVPGYKYNWDKQELVLPTGKIIQLEQIQEVPAVSGNDNYVVQIVNENDPEAILFKRDSTIPVDYTPYEGY